MSPETDLNLIGALRRQALRPRTIVPILLAVAGLLLALRSVFGISPMAMWAQLRSTNVPLLLAAVCVFYLTCPVRVLRWRVLLRNAGQGTLPSLSRLTRMMVLASFANSISVAQLGDVYRGYLLKKESTASLPMTLGTILAERVVDLVALIGMLAAAALTMYAGRLPGAAVDALVGGVVVSLAGLFALVALPCCQTLVQRMLPARWHPLYARFEQGAVRSLRGLPTLAAYPLSRG